MPASRWSQLMLLFHTHHITVFVAATVQSRAMFAYFINIDRPKQVLFI